MLQPGYKCKYLQSSVLAVCYSVTEYGCPVLTCLAHTDLVDFQLNSMMRLITGTLRSAPLPWLPVLANIEQWQRLAVTQICFLFPATVCHHADPSGQTLIP